MHDLRKKVLLQSGKTQSRRARAKEERAPELVELRKSPGSSPRSSPLSSRAGSRNNSQPGSRYASEDEDEFDGAESEIDADNSLSEDEDLEDQGWVTRLRTRVSQLEESRERNISQRETTLVSYLHLIRHYYAQFVIDEALDSEIFPSLINSIKKGASEKEILAALNALSATLITCPDDTIYDQVSRPLKVVCEESRSEQVKVAAMNALAVALAFGGGMKPDFEDIYEYLLEVVESDGQSVGAEDSGVVVTGALQAWGCVASYRDDLAEATEDGRAMEAFLEQLDSTDVEVQTSAGFNIAHIFEAARDQEKRSGQDAGLQHNQHLALTRMREIVKNWSKRTSRKDRRLLREEFPSIIISIERGVGPGYTDTKSTAGRGGRYEHFNDSDIDLKLLKYASEQRFQKEGLQKKERPYKGGVRKDRHDIIDDWKCHARLEVFKQVLVGGTNLHWLENPRIKSALKMSPQSYDEDDWRRKQDEAEEDDEDEDPEEEGASGGRSRIEMERGFMTNE